MLTKFRRLLLAAILAVPGLSAAQDAQGILDKAREMQLERWQGVNCYAVIKNVVGQQVMTYFERVGVVTDAGGVETLFVPRPDGCGSAEEGDIAATAGDGQPRRMTPEQMEAYAEGLDMTGGAMSSEIEKGLDEAGLPKGLLKSMGGDPWVSPDPGTMMGGMAGFMRAAAEGQREMAAERNENVQQTAQSMADFREMAELVATQTLDGRKAYHLRAEGINQVQVMEEGQEFELQSVSLWLAAKEYVPLRIKMEGVISNGREERPLVIDRTMTDYRNVPDSRMYESYRQTMVMSGLMDEAQKAELREAQAQLAEAEAQMAALPPDQRAMMENMMGDRLQMMRNMAAGEDFRNEVVITSIQVNPGLVAQNSPATVPVVQASQPSGGGDGVLRMVQQNLTALGYSTGNTDGVPATETTIAISQFQAERGMEVTGSASPQLAGILAAEAGKQQGAASAASGPAEDLQAAREACLREKIEAAQANQKKKRGFRRLASAVNRTALGSGNYDLARKTQDVYNASATAEDLAAAAEDLGLTQDDIEACENPG